jgi:hypothetical protein
VPQDLCSVSGASDNHVTISVAVNCTANFAAIPITAGKMITVLSEQYAEEYACSGLQLMMPQ